MSARLKTCAGATVLALIGLLGCSDEEVPASSGGGGSGGFAQSGGAGGNGTSSGSDGGGGGASSCVVGAPWSSIASSGTPKAFTSVEVYETTATITIEEVTYDVGPLSIKGQVCRPLAPGPHPVIVHNHGGVDGLGGNKGGSICRNGAGAGFVVASSSYRGEDGSDGEIELCEGEVDDALELLAVVLDQDYADDARVGMFGDSHGGCITLRALHRGAPIHAAAALYAPVDWAAAYDFIAAKVAGGDPGPPEAPYSALLAAMTAAAGGSPSEVPEPYAVRSAVSCREETQAFAGSLLMVQGTADPYVPLPPTCSFVAGVGSFAAYHVTTTQALTARAPAGCDGALAWTTSSPLSAWPGTRHFGVFDGAGHKLSGQYETPMLQVVFDYLATKLAP